MKIIDLLSQCPEPESSTFSTTRKFHARENDDGRAYTHHILRTLGGVYENLIAKIPERTSVVDMGSGAYASFSREQLARRDHSLVTVDFDSRLFMHAPPESSHHVGLDVRQIPDSFVSERPLVESLKLFEHATNVDAVREQVQLLIKVLGERPVGCYVLSQLLIYLEPEVAKKVLSICLRDVVPGGTVALFERTSMQTADMHTVLAGSTDGFSQAKDLAAPQGGYTAEEFFLVPMIPKAVAAPWASRMMRTRNQDIMIQELFKQIGTTVALDQVPPDEFNCTAGFTQEGDEWAANTLAQHVLYLTKNA